MTSEPPATVRIIKTIFEGLVNIVKVIRCKITCSSCKSDCQQPPTPTLQTIPESKAIQDFYTTLRGDIEEHEIVKKTSV